MRSVSSFQTNQNHPYFSNSNTDKGVSPLVSQYMDMFDPSKVNMSLLQKRERPSVDDLLQSELQKKVKTLMGAMDRQPMNPLAAMLFNQNLPLIQNIPVKTEVKSNFAEQLKMNSIRNMQQAMNFRQDALQLLQSQIQQQAPLTFKTYNQKPCNKTVEEVYVKEEYLKDESPLTKESHTIVLPKPKMCDIMSENNTTNDSLSEASHDKADFIMPSPISGDEPVLTEFTRAFPDWDLATIFSFLKSGKSMDAFEKEKKFRLERKLKKQRTSKKDADTKPKQSKKAM